MTQADTRYPQDCERGCVSADLTDEDFAALAVASFRALDDEEDALLHWAGIRLIR